jgi:hypothetical protein
VEDRISITRVLLQFLDSLDGGHNEQLDFAALGFASDFVHDRQGARARTNNKAPAVPRNLLFDGKRRVAVCDTEFL